MTKWLSKFTERPLSSTANADILSIMSVLSVSDSPILEKNSHSNLKGEPLATLVEDSLNENVLVEEVKALYEERAAVFEYEGNMSRTEAEDRAYQYILGEFVRDHHPNTIKLFEEIIYDIN